LYINFEVKPKQRGIFVHIPRAAGTTVSRHIWPWASRMFLAHATASFVRDNIGKRQWDKYFTFAFVRNPWERIVSYYLLYREYTQYNKIDRRISFDDFLEHDSLIMGSFGYNGWLLSEEMWSQKIFITNHLDSKEIIVDFIGKFEDFDKDFGFVCDKLEINKNWRKKNANSKYDYRDYYTDETRKLIEKRCRWEIEKFGYEY